MSNLEVKVKVHTITITDNETGESETIRTVRSLEQVVADTKETEKEAARSAVEDALYEAL